MTTGDIICVYDGITEEVPNDVTIVKVQDNVLKIPIQAFKTCKNLVSVEMSDTSSLLHIGAFAFSFCKNLVSIELPSSIQRIDDGAFFNCRSLSSITLPSSASIEHLGRSVFYGCSSLLSINLPSSITKIGKDAFQKCTSLTSIIIPPSVTTIPDLAFAHCTSLISITLPPAVEHVGRGVFDNCHKVQSVQIQSKMDQINRPILDLLFSILQKNPQIAQTPCTSDSITPLHIYSMYGYFSRDDENGISRVIQAAPRSLTISDPIYSMYPFLLAACIPRLADDDILLLTKNDTKHTEAVYLMLREAAGLMVAFTPK